MVIENVLVSVFKAKWMWGVFNHNDVIASALLHCLTLNFFQHVSICSRYHRFIMWFEWIRKLLSPCWDSRIREGVQRIGRFEKTRVRSNSKVLSCYCIYPNKILNRNKYSYLRYHCNIIIEIILPARMMKQQNLRLRKMYL